MLTIPQAAEQLNVTQYLIRKEIERGNLKSYRLGEKLLRIKQEDLDAYATSNPYEPTEKPMRHKQRDGRVRLVYKPGMKVV